MGNGIQVQTAESRPAPQRELGPWELAMMRKLKLPIPPATPGPWWAEATANGWWIYSFVKGFGARIAVIDGGNSIDAPRGNAHLIAAAPTILSELQAAHQIIKNVLGILTPEQAAKWADLNAASDIDSDGATRAHERIAAITRAIGSNHEPT